MPRGRLIVLEGLDGTGKSTQVTRLYDKIRSLGQPAVIKREPGGSDISERIRTLVKDPALSMNVRTEALLMNAARSEVAEEIDQTLSHGVHVIGDRNYISTLTYQGYGRGLALKPLHDVCLFALNGLVADLTIVLETSLETRAQRLGVRGTQDRFELESGEFFSKVQEGYRRIAQQYGYPMVNAEGTPEQVEMSIWALIEPLIQED